MKLKLMALGIVGLTLVACEREISPAASATQTRSSEQTTPSSAPHHSRSPERTTPSPRHTGTPTPASSPAPTTPTSDGLTWNKGSLLYPAYHHVWNNTATGSYVVCVGTQDGYPNILLVREYIDAHSEYSFQASQVGETIQYCAFRHVFNEINEPRPVLSLYLRDIVDDPETNATTCHTEGAAGTEWFDPGTEPYCRITWVFKRHRLFSGQYRLQAVGGPVYAVEVDQSDRGGIVIVTVHKPLGLCSECEGPVLDLY